jgi:cerevisin
MTYTYLYTQPAGDGVDIYILDSGVYTEHNEFEGRASFGWGVSGLGTEDGYGHGTYIAALAAGKTYGVAKNANIIAVKVVNDQGGTNVGYLIDGLNWVAANVRSTGRPSIACMSINGSHSLAINSAAAAMISGGTTLVVSAGNDGRDAKDDSPASVAAAVVVGAVDITNAMEPSSNFGPFVDVFAPGVDITAAGTSDPSSTRTGSGTSPAAGQVAGIAAYFLSKDPTMTPSELQGKIVALATQNVLTGIPPNTDNALAYNNGNN